MSYVNRSGRSMGHSVPNTYAQGKACGETRPFVPRDSYLPPKEIDFLRSEIEQMRVEATEAEARIERLEDLLTANGIEVP